MTTELMRKKLNLSHLTEEECERILQVIQRDFELRQNEKHRLSKIEEEIQEEGKKVEILGKQKKFNDNCCMRCFSRFFFIFNQKLQCYRCQYYICKSCSEYVSDKKAYCCNVCSKQVELEKESLDWFYNNVKKKFKRFGSAKVVRSLYKRKTDSDSENDSGYDPSMYSNSLPIGKRQRQGIEGFFDNLNKHFQKELLTSTAPAAIENHALDSDEDGKESPISASQENTNLNQTPYTCTVAPSSNSYNNKAFEEIKNFRIHLNDIVNEVHETLGSKALDIEANTNSMEQYEHLLDSHRLQLGERMSNLSHNLFLAIENDELGDSLPSPSARQQYIKQMLTKEVEKYVESPIDLGDDTTSEYASEDGSTSEGSSGKPYEDALADVILKKIIADYLKYEEEYHRNEEEKVRRDLTKLSNQCTITQLQEVMSCTTESETDDGPSLQTSVDINESDLSDIQEDAALEQQEEMQYGRQAADDSSTKSDDEVKSPQRRKKLKKHGSSNSLKSEDSVDLDDLVYINAEYSNQLQKAQEVSTSSENEVADLKSSQSREDFKTSESVKLSLNSGSVTSTPVLDRKQQDINSNELDVDASSIEFDSPRNNVYLETDDKISILKENIPVVGSEKFTAEVLKPKSPDTTFNDSDLNKIDDDLDKSERSLDTDEDRVTSEFDNSDDENSLLEFVKKRDGVALPSLSDEENTDIDLDDISRHSDIQDTTFDSEFVFGDPWVLRNNKNLFGWNTISPYDNCGEKKVGKDIEGPVFMLIPDDPCAPKIGEKEIGELSDGTLTGSEDEDSEAEEELNFAYLRHMVAGEALGSYNDVVREELPEVQEPRVITEEEVIQRVTSEIFNKKLLEEEPEPDPEDADPRFVVKPKHQMVEEGEFVSFQCQVAGTELTDVFWYHDMADVTQIEDDDHYDITENKHTGTHMLNIYNVTPAHQGSYLCIAVNDNGQSHHSFKLLVKDNEGEKAAPKFLKELQDLEILDGSTATFRCKLQGYPTPRVLWYKDGKRIHSSPHYITEKIGNRDYTLTINCASLEDDAEYTVAAKNMVGEARCSAQLLVEARPQATILSPASSRGIQSMDLADKRSSGLYPEADELLKIAEEVHAKRSSVTGTARSMLRSADDLSNMHRQLDEMDRKLNSLEDEVAEEMIDSSYHVNSSLREAMLREHYDMKTAAEGVRKATSQALELLVDIEDRNEVTSEASPLAPTRKKAKGNVEENMWSKVQKTAAQRRSDSPIEEQIWSSVESKSPTQELESSSANYFTSREEVVIATDSDEEKDECDLNLSFQEYEKLYRLGLITREQIRKGRVSKSDMPKLMEALKQNMPKTPEPVEEFPEDGDTIDCGLKRIPSKRYKRDYVINRSPVAQRRKWEVQQPSPLVTEVVKATPAGLREQVSLDEMEDEDLSQPATPDDIIDHSEDYFGYSTGEILDNTEENVYMASGKVYSLEERIKQLERSISAVDEDNPEELDRLEDEVARMVAQTHNSDNKVTQIERTVKHLEHRIHDEPERDVIKPERDVITPRHQSEENLTLPTPIKEQDTESKQTDHDEQNVLQNDKSIEEDMDMPSVKSLRSIFNNDSFRNPDGSMKRVYSLTGRDIPRTVREKLKRQTPSVVPESSRNEPKKRGNIMSLFDDSELRVQSIDSTNNDDILPQDSMNVTKSSSGQSASRYSNEASHNQATTGSSPVLQQTHSFQELSHGGSSKRSPGILARAAFWDNRVNREQLSDTEVKDKFPQLSEYERNLQQQKAANFIPLQLKEFESIDVKTGKLPKSP